MRKNASGAAFVVACGIALAAAGCDSRMRAKVPAMPAPPPPPAPPLILTQTTVELPPAQPVPPESIPPRISVKARAAETAEPVIQIVKRPPAAPAKARPSEAVRTVPSPPSGAPNPAAEVALDPVVGVLQTADDALKSTARIEARIAELRGRLRPFAKNREAARIESFLRLATQALKRGEPRQANAMADRAQTLLAELTRR